jgi:hypothetical protein
VWCQDNNLSFNVIKTKEMIVDYGKNRTSPCSSTGLQWSKFRASSSLVSTSPTIMVQAHQDSREEGTTKPIPPQETEKIWHGSTDLQKVLQLHHRELPDWLHHCLVWQLLGLRQEGTTEGSANGPVHHWGQASCHPESLYQAVSDEGPINCQQLQPVLPHGKRCRSYNPRSKRLLNSFYPQVIRLLKV